MTMNQSTRHADTQSTQNKDTSVTKGERSPEIRIEGITKAVRRASDALADTVREQPMAAVGIAVGAGFVLGSTLGTRLGRLVLTAAAGYAAQELLDRALGEGGIAKLLSNEIAQFTERAEGSSGSRHSSKS